MLLGCCDPGYCGGGYCKDRVRVGPVQRQSCDPKFPYAAWQQGMEEPWPLWGTPCGHRAELGIQVWSHSATDLLRDLSLGLSGIILKISTTVAVPSAL